MLVRSLAAAAILSVALGSVAFADLSITGVNSPVVITLDGTLANVNNGSYTGAGLTSAPAAGQLDSDTWLVTGLSDGNTTEGGSHTTGDFARGASAGGVTTGGLYGFDRGGGNRMFGIQPTDLDLTPGTLTLLVRNNTGQMINRWEVGYDIFTRNDQARSNSVNFAFSTDGTNYTNVPLLNFTSPVAADGTPSWVQTPRGTLLVAGVADNSRLYLRWVFDDVGGSGSRDEFGLDNFSIKAVPEPGHFACLGLLALSLGAAIMVRRRSNRQQHS